MSQLKNVVDPFGEVNVYPTSDGQLRVVATILMEPDREGTQTGVALDGSGSMRKLYGGEGSRVVSSIFAKKTATNDVSPVAQQICAYLARKIDADGGTTCIYWAVGPDGNEIEVVGDFRAEEAETHTFGPPQDFGTGTRLLPAVKYFVERFKDAPWGFYVFITDGELFDLEEVKAYSVQLARDIAAGRRKPVKFVLIGLGSEVNERQMEDLDDLETGTQIDLWDHKLASELRALQQIFAEVVDKNARVAERGRLLSPSGQVLKDYRDIGVPALLEFTVPQGTAYFTLEVNGNRIHQALSDQAQVPAAEIQNAMPTSSAKAATAPGTVPPPPTKSTATTSSTTPQPPPPPPQRGEDELIEDAGEVVKEREAELWEMIDLQKAEEEEKKDE